MGYYDTIFSNFDLGPGFWNRTLKTQNLDNLFSEYWLDPKGRFWSIDYTGTYDFEDHGDFKLVKSTNNGRVTPFNFTKQIEVYPAVWSSWYAPTPRAIVSIEHGQVKECYYAGN
jgi:hypothetical protein